MYMIYQQYTTAVKNVYAGEPDVAQHAETAKFCREWLETLEIGIDLQNALVEPIRVLEEAFEDLVEQQK